MEEHMDVKVFVEKGSGSVPVTVLHVDGNIDSSTYTIFQAKADETIKAGAPLPLDHLDPSRAG